jgi:putative resolvase
MNGSILYCSILNDYRVFKPLFAILNKSLKKLFYIIIKYKIKIMVKLVSRKEVLEILKIHHSTLYNMLERNELEVVKIGTKNFYNIEKYLKEHNITLKEEVVKRKICYCRVSSNHQKDDLERQISLVKDLYPNHELISEVGSGLNFKRKGFLKCLDYAIKGELGELVVVYKDRLCRFGYEMVEHLVTTYSEGRIIIINKTEEKTPLEEITEDILSIMNIYTAKINGLRKYKKAMKREILGENVSLSDSE